MLSVKHERCGQQAGANPLHDADKDKPMTGDEMKACDDVVMENWLRLLLGLGFDE